MLNLNQALTLAEQYDTKLKDENPSVTTAEVRPNQVGGVHAEWQLTFIVDPTTAHKLHG